MFKCPECGYLGFEEETRCPKCGTSVAPVNSGEETNFTMGPPGEEKKVEEKPFLIEEPTQIEKPVETVKETVPGEEVTPETPVAPVVQQELPITQKPLTDTKIEQPQIIDTRPGVFTRAIAFSIDMMLVVGITIIFILIPVIFSNIRIESMGTLIKTLFLPFYLMFIIFHLLYHTYFLTITAQTPGKFIAHLKVVGRGGLKLDWHESLLRALGYLLSLLPAGLGFFWALIDKKQEAWHDKLTGSKVVSISQ